MKTIFALPVIGWLAVFPAQGQDAPPAFEQGESTPEEELDPFDPLIGAPRLIRVQVEYIDLSHKDLTRLMMEEKPVTADAKALRMKVQGLVEKEEAKVIDTQIVMGRSGQKQTSESREEYIYPTEYEPPGSEKLMEELAKQGIYPQNPAVPTAFETKNLGSSLETEPTVGTDNKTIDLRFISELIWHTGESVWYEGKDKAGNMTRATTPEFYILATNTSITCITGQYVMVGALSPKDEKGEVNRDRKIMVFVKCDILAAIP